MSVILPIIPFSGSQDYNSADMVMRNLTIVFGLYPPYSSITDPNGELDLSITRSGHEIGTRCARSGNWFPGERLTIDGRGRKVGDIFYTDGPIVPVIPPFPVFGQSPGNEN